MGKDELSQVAKKAMADATFREQLKRDPEGAASALGVQLSDDDLHQLRATDLAGLSDEDLINHMNIFVADG